MTRPSTDPDSASLRFESLPEILRHVEGCGRGPVETTGNWSAGQIVQHIAEAIAHSIDGYDVKASATHRARSRLMKSRFLRKGFPTGITLPDEMSHLLPDDDAGWDAAVANLRAEVERAETVTLAADHPFLGKLSDAEWRQFHCRHAELHFGFLRPA